MAETIRERLEKIAKASSSTDEDSRFIEKIYKMLGFPNAVAVLGVLYLEGKGRPISVHQGAEQILKIVAEAEKKKAKKLEEIE